MDEVKHINSYLSVLGVQLVLVGAVGGAPGVVARLVVLRLRARRARRARRRRRLSLVGAAIGRGELFFQRRHLLLGQRRPLQTSKTYVVL